VRKPFKLVLPEGAHTLEDIAAAFATNLDAAQPLIVEVPLPSVGNSNSYLDLVQDFSDASLICERLGACASNRSMQWSKAGHEHVILLELEDYVPDAMALELAWMAILLDYPNCEADSLRSAYDEVREAWADHEINIPNVRLLFPEIADHYLGNLVMGAYYEWEDADLLRAELERHPERRYGFFISRSLSSDCSPVLSSDGQLIVPSGTSIEDVMRAVGYDGERLLPAEMVMTTSQASFAANHAVVGVRAEDVFSAIACGDDFVRRMQADPDSHDLLGFQGRPYASINDLPAGIGELSGCAALGCIGFTVLFLDAEPVASWQRTAEADRMRSLEISIRAGGSPATGMDLAWEKLDDELFEQLCYDYLYANPFFDKHRLEKIGKSRSRDGGRDIVAWTSPAPPMFRPPVKYIFQCKHIGADASLTPKHFRSVSDVIEQYGAGGYGVMCSGYIDATLHDRVDSIAARRNVEVRKVDRLQLERFLSHRPSLVERYFGNRSNNRR